MKSPLIPNIVITLLLSTTAIFADVAAYNETFTGTYIRDTPTGSEKTNYSGSVLKIVELTLTAGTSRIAEFVFFDLNSDKYFAYASYHNHLYFHVGDASTGGRKTVITLADQSKIEEDPANTSMRSRALIIKGLDSTVRISDSTTTRLPKTLKGEMFWVTAGPLSGKFEVSHIWRFNEALTKKVNNRSDTFEEALEAAKAELRAQGYLED